MGKFPKLSPAEYAAIYDEAWKAGVAAATDAVPVPMQVVQRANPLDDKSPIVKAYEPVYDGVCGFAWVKVKPSNSPFAKWLKANGKVSRDRDYDGGVSIWIGAYQQSYERKSAHAGAMAKVLRDKIGGSIYSQDRLD